MDFNRWKRLYESAEDKVADKLAQGFSKLRDYVEDELMYDEFDNEIKPYSFEFQVIHHQGVTVEVYRESEVMKARSFISMHATLSRDEDKQRLFDLGLIDDAEMIEKIEGHYQITIYPMWDHFEVGPIHDVISDFELDPKSLFDSGNLTDPNTEYFNDFLMDEIYREVNMKMDDRQWLRSELDDAVYTKISKEEDEDYY